MVTRGLMGLSVTCARCHDHKFDPIPTEDYYSLHGVFASSVEPAELPLLPDAVPEADKADYDRERQARLDKVAQDRVQHRAKIEAELRDHLAAFTEAAFAIDFEPRGPKLDEAARAHKVSPERLRFVARTPRRSSSTRRPRGTTRSSPPGGPSPPSRPASSSRRPPSWRRRWPSPTRPGRSTRSSSGLRRRPAQDAGRGRPTLRRAVRAGREVVRPGPRGRPARRRSPTRPWTPIHARLVAAEGPLVVPPEALDRVLNRAEREKLQALEKKVAELDVTHPGSPGPGDGPERRPEPDQPPRLRPGQPRPARQGGPPPVPPRPLRAARPSPSPTARGRLELARAIASPDNPLTARVMVNRIWHHHFGVGLVATPSDFGVRGEPPSHPELLDFLARRFVEGGWSVKAMHRLILLSSTYQQKSDRRDDGFAADPTNRLLWRQNRRRLDFEAMRDGVLAVAGKLDPTMGGRPVELFDPKSPSTRRTVYGLVDRYDLDADLPDLRLPQPRHQRPDAAHDHGPAAGPLPAEQPVPARPGPRPRHAAPTWPRPARRARIARLHLDLFGRPRRAPRGRARPPVRRGRAPRPKGPTPPPPGRNMPRSC